MQIAIVTEEEDSVKRVMREGEERRGGAGRR